MNITSLSNDHEFKTRWPYVWQKLEPLLLKMQRDYATMHKGEHEKVGMFVEFLAELMEALNGVDVEVTKPEKTPRKRLNNDQFR